MNFEAIGTRWSIETDQVLSERVQEKVMKLIEAFDKTYSRFRPDSLISHIARNAGIYTFPPDMDRLFSFYETLYTITHGKVTPLIGSMLEKAGYDAVYSLTQRKQVPIPTWQEAIHRNGVVLKVKQPVTIDVGAAGKGYLVDLVCELLDDAGVTGHIVDAGGDMRHKGESINKVGLEDPRDPTKVIGVINVENKSICASAINRRRWGDDQHHIFDPDMMQPTRDITATWVIAESTMVADGLATALFFSEPNVLRTTFDYEYARMHSDGSIDYSPAFDGKLF
ncbi:FAD:protein FMN transferase [Candidatus Saccharibacteria bacterium]|nr:FAD:protein FMN transferase [Candidatus Saccharibacteria bacterium]